VPTFQDSENTKSFLPVITISDLQRPSEASPIS